MKSDLLKDLSPGPPAPICETFLATSPILLEYPDLILFIASPSLSGVIAPELSEIILSNLTAPSITS
jgi:hypothetical protein